MFIINNAIIYNDKERAIIKVILSADKQHVTIEIKDNGPGIGKDLLPHIFDRFYSADPARTASKSGSGLGLAIAQQITLGHGGRIWAKSEPEKGTSIFISLNKI